MKTFFTAVLVFITGLTLWSQVDSAGLNHLVDSIVLAGIKPDQPGVAVGIIQNGKIVFMKGYGMANLDYEIPVTAATKFNLASCSKQFTAACCLQLEKEGRLDMDTDIHTYLPELPDYGQKITVRQLMHHTSGIPTTDVLMLFSGTIFETAWDQEDEMKLIKSYTKLNFTPNAEHLYCNPGYFLMAKIIEKCSGKSFNDYLQQAICQPLGMKNTAVYDHPGLVMKDRSTGYAQKGEQFVERLTLESTIIGSTNQYTTLGDMLLWDMALLNGELLGPGTTARFFVPSDTFNNGDTIKYTCGFNVWKYKGEKIAEHGGLTAGFVSRNQIFPDRGIAIVALANNENANVWGISMGIADKLMNLREEPGKVRTEVAIDKGLYTEYTGTYQLSDGMRFTIELTNDTLWVLIPGAPKFRLVAESTTDFFLKEFDAQCSFAIIKDNKAQRFIWHQEGTDHPGIRVSTEAEPTEKDLLLFAGNYRNDILNITYPVIVKDKKIFIVLPDCFPKYVGIEKELPLTHLDGDRFYGTNLGPVVFQRNNKKKVTGLTFMDVGRVRNIEFVKVKM